MASQRREPFAGLRVNKLPHSKAGFRRHQGKTTRKKRRRDPSTTRPDAPQCGAGEKIGSLRSG
jgi:hypothetical protein